MPRSLYDVSYRGSFAFPAPPELLWESLQRTDLFETWWPWMRDVTLDGDALAPGSRISFRIDPPVPYEMHVSVDVEKAEPPDYLEGLVSGDLNGTASLRFVPEGPQASTAVTAWDVEVASKRIRPVIVLARPVLLWAQKWAVEVSLRGFRRYLAERGGG